MEPLTEELFLHLKQFGFAARVVSIQRLYELKDEIENRHTQGQLADEFYQERLNFYRFNPPGDLPSVKSLIVVAIPRPQTPVRFTTNGKKFTLILPPTYSGYSETSRKIGEILNEFFRNLGYRVASAALPLKLLAARSGLVEYGRNNVSYIPGMGSFFQLAAFYSNLPCVEDSWQEARMMDRCQHCRACQKTCPTGAIAADRFLLHAERCIVFHNERSGSHPFPSWIDPAVHHCLMGCMSCQQICLENKPFLNWFDDGQDFSAEETTLLLSGTPRAGLPAETVKKLESLELIDDVEKLPRNLGVFLGYFAAHQQIDSA